MSDMRIGDSGSDKEIVYGEPASDEEVAWYKFALQAPHQSFEAVNRASTTLVQVLSIVIPGFVAAIVASGSAGALTLIRWPLICWCVALMLALTALMPWPVKIIIGQPLFTRDSFSRMRKIKWVVLAIAGLSTCAGMCLLLFVGF